MHVYSSSYKTGSACGMKTNSRGQLSGVLHVCKASGSVPIMSNQANAKEEANTCADTFKYSYTVKPAVTW